MSVEIFVLLYTATIVVGGMIWLMEDDMYGHR